MPVRAWARRALPGRVRRSYAAKLAVGFLVVLLVVGAIGAVTYAQSSQELEAVTESRLESSSELQGIVLGHWLASVQGDARELSESPTIREGSPTTIDSTLDQKMTDGALPDSVAAVHYLNVDAGRERTYTSVDPPADAPTGDLPWRRMNVGLIGSGSAVVTPPYESPVTDGPAMAIVSPIAGEGDRAIVLVVDLVVRSESLPRSSDDVDTVVVNSAGTVVMSHDTERILTQNMGPSDQPGVDSMAVEKSLDGEIGYMQMDMQGGTLAMGYAPVEGADWSVMTHQPTASAFALQQDISRGILLLLLATLLGFLAIGLTLGKGTLDSLNVLSKRAKALEDGDLDVELETRREDEIGDLFAAFDSMRSSLREMIVEAETERERSEELVAHLEEKAEAYRETMEATAAGDLTRRMDTESRSEAMTEIGEAFNGMAADLEATIGSVQSFADTVSEASETVTASAEEVRNAGEEVSEAVQEISDGADDQTRGLKEVSSELDGLSATIEEIAASSDEVATTSRSAAERGETGRTAAEEAIEGMSQIEARAEETASAVERLNDEMAAVSEVVELIEGIAEQTSTLALNASIEAARAGEAGKGFAVVADEVKSLAEETREATAEIEGRIESLEEEAEESAADVRRMRDGIAEGTDAVEEAATALAEIVDDVEDVDVGVQDIDDATDEQAESTQEVVSKVESVAATSQQVDHESDNVAAAAEEQAASLSEVTENASRLSERARDLRQAMAGFVVDSSAKGDDGLDVDVEPVEGMDFGPEHTSPADD